MPLEQSKKNLQPPSLSHLIKDYFRVRREMRESQKSFGGVNPMLIEAREKLKHEIFSIRNEMKLVLALASLTIAAGILGKYHESKSQDETVVVAEAMATAYEELKTANQNQRHLYMDFMGCSILLDKIRELRESAIPPSLEKEAAEIGRGVQSTNAMIDQYIESRNPKLRKKLLKQQEELKDRIEKMDHAIEEILVPYMNVSLENETEIQIYFLERLIDLAKKMIAPIPEDSERRRTFDQEIMTIQYFMDITKAALKGDRGTMELSNELPGLINNLKEIIIALSRPAVFSEFRTWEEWTQEAQQ